MKNFDPKLPRTFDVHLAEEPSANPITITEYGKALIHDDGIELIKFDGSNGSCREQAIASLMLLREQIDYELDAMLKMPGGTGAVSVD